MYGMKINYSKSEVSVVGIDQAEHETIANILNCSVGTFPMVYLGIPVSDCKLLKGQLNFVNGKVANKLAT